VLRQACAEAANWPHDVIVAINLSPAQFKSRNLVPTVINALATSGLAAARLELEITELVLLQETEGAFAILHQLRDLGIKIAMDDFGTGYSSLGYLRSFPFDKIKIDQSFIQDLSTKEDSLAIVRAVVGLSSSLGIIGFVLRVLVWLLVILLALDNFGVDITALVAGLGVGGIAVALAVQNVLGDLFASLSITLDRPFVLGDFIVVDDFAGSVEHIGVKSTRLRSLHGEQIVMANADLLGSRIRNYGRMQERRVLFTLGVTYETPREALLQIPAIIRRCIETQAETRFDRSHFAHYGASSLDFETVYFVLSADFTKHMDIRQAVYFAIHEAFEAAAIKRAYPTQKLWLAPVEPGSGTS